MAHHLNEIFIYYAKDGGPFVTPNLKEISFKKLHSPNEETPAIIYLLGTKEWHFEGKQHRLTGPAVIMFDNHEVYYLNGKSYKFKEWIHNHPDLNYYLEANGYKTEAQKALWKLKNL